MCSYSTWVDGLSQARSAETTSLLCGQSMRQAEAKVILILTKYYHADSTKVLESSLWRPFISKRLPCNSEETEEVGWLPLGIIVHEAEITMKLACFQSGPKRPSEHFLIVCFRQTSVEELYRSTDYGTTYTKLNLMPGTTIVVTSFFICPTNKKKLSA
ncbi:hypothetical protein PAMP_015474 [Pampus punctatissimus]